RVLAELDGARADLAALSGAVIGRVRIGAIQALDPFDLSGALAAFHARHPDVELELRSGGVRTLLDDELVLVTAPEHPTASVGALGLAALRADPFVCLPVGTGLRTVLHRHAA